MQDGGVGENKSSDWLFASVLLVFHSQPEAQTVRQAAKKQKWPGRILVAATQLWSCPSGWWGEGGEIKQQQWVEQRASSLHETLNMASWLSSWVDFGPFGWKQQLTNYLCFSVFVLSAGVSEANSVEWSEAGIQQTPHQERPPLTIPLRLSVVDWQQQLR